MAAAEHKLLGHSVRRKEGRDKVTGRARYRLRVAQNILEEFPRSLAS
jgi:CO/xanthine dehydrogenase Mo-binding subunit